jgi:hypothetical protein
VVPSEKLCIISDQLFKLIKTGDNPNRPVRTVLVHLQLFQFRNSDQSSANCSENEHNFFEHGSMLRSWCSSSVNPVAAVLLIPFENC